MPRIIKEPECQFKCHSCGCVAIGEPHEFSRQNTMPPTWEISCPFCHATVVCSPTPLIAKAAQGW